MCQMGLFFWEFKWESYHKQVSVLVFFLLSVLQFRLGALETNLWLKSSNSSCVIITEITCGSRVVVVGRSRLFSQKRSHTILSVNRHDPMCYNRRFPPLLNCLRLTYICCKQLFFFFLKWSKGCKIKELTHRSKYLSWEETIIMSSVFLLSTEKNCNSWTSFGLTSLLLWLQKFNKFDLFYIARGWNI